MSKEIEAAVDAILQEAGVKYAAVYAGEAMLAQGRDKPWRCDRWRVSLGAYQTDYHTGLGHRKAHIKFIGLPVKNPYTPRTIAWEDWEKLHVKPRTPPAAGPLYSFVCDADAANWSFNDWSANYGYSSDSIAAFNVYQACCAVAVELRKVFKPETLQRLREILQDY